MTDLTVTVAAAPAMGSFSVLKATFDDVEGPFPGMPLLLDAPNLIRGLPDGRYTVALSGLHLTPAVGIEVTVAIPGSSKMRSNAAKSNGSLAGLLPFLIQNGKVR